MKLILLTLMLLAGCSPTVDEFKAAKKKCAEIGREAKATEFGGLRCCTQVDCGVTAK